MRLAIALLLVAATAINDASADATATSATSSNQYKRSIQSGVRKFFNLIRRHMLSVHCGRNRFDSVYLRFLSTQPRSARNLYKRIIGGEQSDSGQWPWLVSLRFRKPDGSYMHACGGTLIHPQWVLSASHCFEDSKEYPFINDMAKNWVVRIGEHDMNVDDRTHLDMKVRRIFTNPDRIKMVNSDDIALIMLAKDTPITDNKNVACMPSTRDVFRADTMCTTAGWGIETVNSSNHATVLRHVEVPIVSKAECSGAYRRDLGNNKSFVTITDQHMCAGMPEGGRDSCQFDSGGPLLCRNPALPSQWLVAGVISSGKDCGKQGFPGVYVKVSSYIDWINDVLDFYT